MRRSLLTWVLGPAGSLGRHPAAGPMSGPRPVQCSSSVAEVAPPQAVKVALLFTAVGDVRVRVAAEPSIPVRPVFIVWIAFLTGSALREFSRDPLDRPL